MYEDVEIVFIEMFEGSFIEGPVLSSEKPETPFLLETEERWWAALLTGARSGSLTARLV